MRCSLGPVLLSEQWVVARAVCCSLGSMFRQCVLVWALCYSLGNMLGFGPCVAVLTVCRRLGHVVFEQCIAVWAMCCSLYSVLFRLCIVVWGSVL